jgi:hypothetical protein
MVCADPSRVIAKQTVDLLHWHMHHHTGEVTERAQWAWRDAVVAEQAQREADRSANEVDRGAWLRIVQGWLGLIHKRPQSEDDKPAK